MIMKNSIISVKQNLMSFEASLVCSMVTASCRTVFLKPDTYAHLWST